MKWPGSTPNAGAVLQVLAGNAWVTKEHRDWWGLFRLLDTGRILPASDGNQFRVQWEIQTPDARTVLIQYDLKTRSSKNPFLPGIIAQFRCLRQL